MNPSYYKYCMVPQCKSTSIKTPNKLFIFVPSKVEVRKEWLELARRNDANCLSSISRMYFCEDHFDLPNDMLNYTEYHIMGKVSKVLLKPGCTPSKFECQKDRRKRTSSSIERQFMLKKKKMEILAECLDENTNNMECQKNPEETCSQSLKDIPHTSSDSQTIKQNEPEPLCEQKVDKSVQVFFTHKFRSKASQTQIKTWIHAYLESDSDQPPAKKAKSHYDTSSCHHTQKSSQGSQNVTIETGHYQDQLNTRHTINVIVNNNKKERQKRYREQNRYKLKQREAERRKRIQYSQSIARPSTSSNTNSIELNNKEIITAQSLFGLEKAQSSSIQRNEQGNKPNALQKKRERQQRYREKNRDKLKQREAERRRCLQNAEMNTELSTSPNMEFIEIINDITIDEISTNSRSVAGLEEMQHLVVEVSQQKNTTDYTTQH